MDVDHPEFDQDWDAAARSETQAERLDRNWSSLLQELRDADWCAVADRVPADPAVPSPFAQLGDDLHTVYPMTVACSLAATVLLVAPVAMPRLLFRRHRLNTVVAVTHRCAYAGLLLLGTALTGVAIVVFGAVLGTTAAAVAGVLTAVAMLIAWVAFPLWKRHGSGRPASSARRAGVWPRTPPGTPPPC